MVVPVKEKPSDTTQHVKIDYLNAVHEAVTKADSRVIQVMLSFKEHTISLLMANSLGNLCKEDRSLIECRAAIVMRDKDQSQMIVEGFGGYMGMEALDLYPPDKLAREIVTSGDRRLRHCLPENCQL